MSEYDQERLSELAEELDLAKEKIRCLEAEVKHLKRETEKEWMRDIYAALLRAHAYVARFVISDPFEGPQTLDQIKAAIKSMEVELTK